MVILNNNTPLPNVNTIINCTDLLGIQDTSVDNSLNDTLFLEEEIEFSKNSAGQSKFDGDYIDHISYVKNSSIHQYYQVNYIKELITYVSCLVVLKKKFGTVLNTKMGLPRRYNIKIDEEDVVGVDGKPVIDPKTNNPKKKDKLFGLTFWFYLDADGKIPALDYKSVEARRPREPINEYSRCADNERCRYNFPNPTILGEQFDTQKYEDLPFATLKPTASTSASGNRPLLVDVINKVAPKIFDDATKLQYIYIVNNIIDVKNRRAMLDYLNNKIQRVYSNIKKIQSSKYEKEFEAIVDTENGLSNLLECLNNSNFGVQEKWKPEAQSKYENINLDNYNSSGSASSVANINGASVLAPTLDDIETSDFNPYNPDISIPPPPLTKDDLLKYKQRLEAVKNTIKDKLDNDPTSIYLGSELSNEFFYKNPKNTCISGDCLEETNKKKWPLCLKIPFKVTNTTALRNTDGTTSDPDTIVELVDRVIYVPGVSQGNMLSIIAKFSGFMYENPKWQGLKDTNYKSILQYNGKILVKEYSDDDFPAPPKERKDITKSDGFDDALNDSGFGEGTNWGKVALGFGVGLLCFGIIGCAICFPWLMAAGYGIATAVFTAVTTASLEGGIAAGAAVATDVITSGGTIYAGIAALADGATFGTALSQITVTGIANAGLASAIPAGILGLFSANPLDISDQTQEYNAKVQESIDSEIKQDTINLKLEWMQKYGLDAYEVENNYAFQQIKIQDIEEIKDSREDEKKTWKRTYFDNTMVGGWVTAVQTYNSNVDKYRQAQRSGLAATEYDAGWYANYTDGMVGIQAALILAPLVGFHVGKGFLKVSGKRIRNIGTQVDTLETFNIDGWVDNEFLSPDQGLGQGTKVPSELFPRDAVGMDLGADGDGQKELAAPISNKGSIKLSDRDIRRYRLTDPNKPDLKRDEINSTLDSALKRVEDESLNFSGEIAEKIEEVNDLNTPGGDLQYTKVQRLENLYRNHSAMLTKEERVAAVTAIKFKVEQFLFSSIDGMVDQGLDVEQTGTFARLSKESRDLKRVRTKAKLTDFIDDYVKERASSPYLIKDLLALRENIQVRRRPSGKLVAFEVRNAKGRWSSNSIFKLNKTVTETSKESDFARYIAALRMQKKINFETKLAVIARKKLLQEPILLLSDSQQIRVPIKPGKDVYGLRAIRNLANKMDRLTKQTGFKRRPSERDEEGLRLQEKLNDKIDASKKKYVDACLRKAINVDTLFKDTKANIESRRKTVSNDPRALQKLKNDLKTAYSNEFGKGKLEGFDESRGLDVQIDELLAKLKEDSDEYRDALVTKQAEEAFDRYLSVSEQEEAYPALIRGDDKPMRVTIKGFYGEGAKRADVFSIDRFDKPNESTNITGFVDTSHIDFAKTLTVLAQRTVNGNPAEGNRITFGGDEFQVREYVGPEVRDKDPAVTCGLEAGLLGAGDDCKLGPEGAPKPKYVAGHVAAIKGNLGNKIGGTQPNRAINIRLLETPTGVVSERQARITFGDEPLADIKVKFKPGETPKIDCFFEKPGEGEGILEIFEKTEGPGEPIRRAAGLIEALQQQTEQVETPLVDNMDKLKTDFASIYDQSRTSGLDFGKLDISEISRLREIKTELFKIDVPIDAPYRKYYEDLASKAQQILISQFKSMQDTYGITLELLASLTDDATELADSEEVLRSAKSVAQKEAAQLEIDSYKEKIDGYEEQILKTLSEELDKVNKVSAQLPQLKVDLAVAEADLLITKDELQKQGIKEEIVGLKELIKNLESIVDQGKSTAETGDTAGGNIGNLRMLVRDFERLTKPVDSAGSEVTSSFLEGENPLRELNAGARIFDPGTGVLHTDITPDGGDNYRSEELTDMEGTLVPTYATQLEIQRQLNQEITKLESRIIKDSEFLETPAFDELAQTDQDSFKEKLESNKELAVELEAEVLNAIDEQEVNRSYIRAEREKLLNTIIERRRGVGSEAQLNQLRAAFDGPTKARATENVFNELYESYKLNRDVTRCRQFDEFVQNFQKSASRRRLEAVNKLEKEGKQALIDSIVEENASPTLLDAVVDNTLSGGTPYLDPDEILDLGEVNQLAEERKLELRLRYNPEKVGSFTPEYLKLISESRRRQKDILSKKLTIYRKRFLKDAYVKRSDGTIGRLLDTDPLAFTTPDEVPLPEFSNIRVAIGTMEQYTPIERAFQAGIIKRFEVPKNRQQLFVLTKNILFAKTVEVSTNALKATDIFGNDIAYLATAGTQRRIKLSSDPARLMEQSILKLLEPNEERRAKLLAEILVREPEIGGGGYIRNARQFLFFLVI